MAKSRKIPNEKQERRIHYNMVAESPPENVFSWYFLIINEQREIERITQRMYDALKPTQDQIIFDKGNVENSHGLKYILFCLKSSVCNLDFSQIYNGRIIKDRKLYQRESGASLLNILEQEGISNLSRIHKIQEKDSYLSDDNPSPDYTM